MKFGKTIHYLLSLLTSITAFFLAYGLLQYFVTRNISGNSVVSEVGKFVLNFATGGFISGAVYAATFRQGFLPLAITPAISFGTPLLVLAIIHGEIGGSESTTLNAWEFAIPVMVGISCGYIGAKIVRQFLN